MAINCTIGSLCPTALLANAFNNTSTQVLTSTIIQATTIPLTSTTNLTSGNGTTQLPFIHVPFLTIDPDLVKIMSTADIVTRWLALISIIVSIFGNFAVILVIMRQGKLPIYKHLIIHLAITDIVYSVFQIFWVHRRFHEHRWDFGEPLCRATIAWSAALTCSMFIITFIAIERYRSIMMPYLPKLEHWVIWCVMGILWVVAIGIHIPFALKRKVVNLYGNTDCEEIWKPDELRDRSYVSLIIFLITYPIPLIILTFCYFRIATRVIGRFSRFKRSDSVRISFGHSNSSNGTPASSNNNNTNESGTLANKALRHQKLILMLSLILLAFIVTTTPNQVFIMWTNFAPKENVPLRTLQKTFVILHILSSIVHLHSCINPFIYCVADARNRREFFKLLTFWRNHRQPSIPFTNGHSSTISKPRFPLSTNQSGDTTTSPLLPGNEKTGCHVTFCETTDQEQDGCSKPNGNPETAI